jgi:hypothetical protein
MHRIARTRFLTGNVRNVSTIVSLALLGIAGLQSCATISTTGSESCTTVLKPLVIQVDFPGTQRKISTGAVREKYFNQLNEYVREMSYNRVCIKGEVTDRWYKLPNPISNYWVPWQNLEVDASHIHNLVSNALNAVDQDIDVSKYDFVIIALAATFNEWGNNGVVAYPIPGLRNSGSDPILFTRSGRKVNRGIMLEASTSRLGQNFHHVAHVLAGVKDGKRVLPCLYDQDKASSSTVRIGSGVESTFRAAQIHMGGWDPMSCNPCLQWPGAPGISAWTKLRLGWLEPSKVRVVNSGEKAQVSLGPLEEASTQTMAIKIPVTDTTYYLVENRQHIGHDRNLPETGVLIMYADDRVAESRYGRGPVRLVNANPTVPHLDSAAFDIDKNASFSDERNDIRIKLLKKNGRSYDILVENAPR